jgi:uncharacterized repeat protein (TIGR03847 family)
VSESFSVERPDAFVCGAVGEPGRRIFYLQARSGSQVVTLRVEKEQVRALGQYLAHLAQQLGDPEPDRDVVGLVEPVVELWTVGDLAVAADADAGTVLIAAEELDEQVWEREDPDEPGDGASANITITAAQAVAFAESAAELVAAGRPTCRFCEQPVEPDGHSCPRWN